MATTALTHHRRHSQQQPRRAGDILHGGGASEQRNSLSPRFNANNIIVASNHNNNNDAEKLSGGNFSSAASLASQSVSAADASSAMTAANGSAAYCGADVSARAPTPRMQGGVALPVVPQQKADHFGPPAAVAMTTAANLQAAQLAQQLLLARVVPQLLLPTHHNYLQSPGGAGGPPPYSYLLAAASGAQQFTPFQLLTAAAAASGGSFLLPPEMQTAATNFGGGGDPLAAAIFESHHQMLRRNSSTGDLKNNNNIYKQNSSLQRLNSVSNSNNNVNQATSALTMTNNNVNSNFPVRGHSAHNGVANRTNSSVWTAEEVEQRISRLISENETLLEPPPVLLKRRSYTRQMHSASLDASLNVSNGCLGQNYGRSLTTGRGLRSQSLVEPTTASFSTASKMLQTKHHQQQLRHAALNVSSSLGNSVVVCSSSSLSNNVQRSSLATATPSVVTTTATAAVAALNFHAQVQNDTLEAMNKLYVCKFCKVGIRHLDELRRHEFRCARRGDDELPVFNLLSQHMSNGSDVGTPPPGNNNNNKHPLKKRILEAAKSQCIPDQACFTQNIVDEKLPVAVYKIAHSSTGVLSLSPVSTSSCDQQQFHPYCVTVRVKNARPNSAPSFEPVRAGRKPNQITQSTFTTSLHKLRPNARCCCHKNPKSSSGESNYALWAQSPVSARESKLNIVMMNGYRTRLANRRFHADRNLTKYSVAEKDMSVMRVTHSSYWTISKQLEKINNANRTVADFPAPSTVSSIDHMIVDDKKDVKIKAEINGDSTTNFPSPKTTLKLNEFSSDSDDGGDDSDETESKRKRFKKYSDSKDGVKGVYVVNENTSDDNQGIVATVTSDRKFSDFGAENEKTINDVLNRDTVHFCERKCRRNGESFSLISKRIRAGNYYGREFKTPPPVRHRSTSSSSNSISDENARCNTAPPVGVNDDIVDIFPSSASSDYYCRRQLSPLNNRSVKPNDRFALNDCLINKKNSSKNVNNNENGKLSVKGSDRCRLEATENSLKIFRRQNVVERSSKRAENNYELSSSVDRRIRCEICSKDFSKIGLYRLHMDGHSLEKSGRCNFKCFSCNANFRTKIALDKHVAVTHRRQRVSSPSGSVSSSAFQKNSILASKNGVISLALSSSTRNQQLSPTLLISSSKSSSSSPSSSSSNNPRPFECADCAVAFRNHGHLAKHLRSKSHIMKLESLEKLPFGVFAKLEENNDYFTEIDTSDCGNALKSLSALGRRLMIMADKKSTVDISLSSRAHKPLVNTDVRPQSANKRVQHDDVIVGHQQRSTSVVSMLPVQTGFSPFPTNKDDAGVDEKKFAESRKRQKTHQPPSCRCTFCDLDFSSRIELDIHLHVDHVNLKDGNNFKCPKAGCESRVYPNKESLRQHVARHFYGLIRSEPVGDNAVVNGNEECSRKFPTDRKRHRRNHRLSRKLTRQSSTGSPETSETTTDSSRLNSSGSVSPVDSVEENPTSAVDDQRFNLKKRKLSRDESIDSVSTPPDKYRATVGEHDASSGTIRSDQLRTDSSNVSNVPSSTQQSVVDNILFQQQQRQAVWNSLNAAAACYSPQSFYLAAAAADQYNNVLKYPDTKNFLNNKMPGVNNGKFSSWPYANVPPYANNLLINAAATYHQQQPNQSYSSTNGRHSNGGSGSHFNNQQLTQEASFSVNQLRCIICQKQCDTPLSLQEHLMSHNPQSRLYVCKFCDAAFTTAQALSAHTPCRQETKVNSTIEST